MRAKSLRIDAGGGAPHDDAPFKRSMSSCRDRNLLAHGSWWEFCRLTIPPTRTTRRDCARA